MTFPTWPNLLRAVALVTLCALGVADYGFDALAKPVAREVYFGLVAVALGVDIKALRDAILRAIGGKPDGGK